MVQGKDLEGRAPERGKPYMDAQRFACTRRQGPCDRRKRRIDRGFVVRPRPIKRHITGVKLVAAKLAGLVSGVRG